MAGIHFYAAWDEVDPDWRDTMNTYTQDAYDDATTCPDCGCVMVDDDTCLDCDADAIDWDVLASPIQEHTP